MLQPFSFSLELLFLLNFQFLGRKLQQMVSPPLFLFFRKAILVSHTGSFMTGLNRQENDFHWLFITVFYQQIENSERANQIHRFTIDHGKFILTDNSIIDNCIKDIQRSSNNFSAAKEERGGNNRQKSKKYKTIKRSFKNSDIAITKETRGSKQPILMRRRLQVV